MNIPVGFGYNQKPRLGETSPAAARFSLAHRLRSWPLPHPQRVSRASARVSLFNGDSPLTFPKMTIYPISLRLIKNLIGAGRFTRCIAVLAALSILSTSKGEEQPRKIAWETRQLSDVFFCEGATAGDIDGDGLADVVSGPYWYEGPDFVIRREVYQPKPFDPHGYSDNFFSYVEDISGDGLSDVLVIGFPGAAAHWYQNPGKSEVRQSAAVWKKHLAIDIVDNESPAFADLTGDGKREIVCSRDGYFGFASPDQTDPTKPWLFTAISDQSAGGRFTHGLGIGDVDGDGRADLLEKTGWWQQPEPSRGAPIWKKHPFPFSAAGGAQMLVTDVDGDGLSDVITSLEAHGYGIVWYRQRRLGERIDFEPFTIVGKQPLDSPFGVVFTQPHAMTLSDIDGDGLLDLVTGKRWWAHGPKGDAEANAPPVIYWFRLERRGEAKEGPPAVFVPYPIDDASGVGTDVQSHDLNSDGLPDLVVGNKRGTFVHWQRSASLPADSVSRSTPVGDWERAKLRPEMATQGLSAEAARSAMTVPPGFSVDLIAAEPRIHQPVAFTLDTAGRIWVAEAHTYPIRAPEGQGKDRIVILEDADSDGAFETRKVFIEGLNLVSGLEVGFGGVWVGAAPYLLFIPDRDHDGAPDSAPIILLDGWGFQDTHEVLSALNWGPDGWLYGCQGVFTHSKVGAPGTPDDARVALNAGVWRYHPIRHQFEVFAHGTSNPWGVDFDDIGQAFVTACVIPHAFHIIQGGRYQRQAGRHFDPYTFDDLKTIADHNHYAGGIADHAWWGGRNAAVHDDATSEAGGGHAHCGAMIYLGDNWPQSYRNALMMANIHGNRINREYLRPDGSGFIASHGRDVIFANDAWFRGINLRYGPDGAVYLIDWYDPNACHRASPEIWDRSNGRLFRIQYGDLTPRKVDLESAKDAELIELHESENDWFVRGARRVLQARHATTPANEASQLCRATLWERAINSSSPSPRRLRYLWASHAIRSLSDDEALTLLADSDENLRAWTLQLLTDRPLSTVTHSIAGGSNLSPRVLATVRALTQSEKSPRVRLYLASLLQRVPTNDRWELVSGLLRDGDQAIDKNIPLMVWYGVGPLVQEDPGRAISLATESQLPLVRQFIYRRVATDPKLLPQLVAALADGVEAAIAQEMVAEMRRGAEQWGKIDAPARWSEAVAKLANSKDESVRQSMQFLSITFGDASVFPSLRKTAVDKQQPLALRREAIAALAQGRDPELLKQSLQLLEDPAVRADVIPLLARFESVEVSDSLLAGYSAWPPVHRRSVIDVLISRPRLAHRLLDAISQGNIPRGALNAIHVGRIEQLGDKALIERMSEVWGAVRPTPDAIRKQIDELNQQLTTQALSDANRSQGRELYTKSCGQCHVLFGEGGKLGPDLTGADRGNVRYWLENILAPNAVVGKDYQTLTALTNDGRVITGLLREETDVAIVLEDAEKRVTLPRTEIESLGATAQSLMPEGLLQHLSITQIADLIAYLQSPGQIPLPGKIPALNPKTGKVPGAIEGETIEVLETSSGRAQAQAMGGFKGSRWSGDAQLWWTDGKLDSHLTVRLPATTEGDYEVFVVLTQAVDYGTVSFSINDSDSSTVIDLFNHPEVITSGPISLGKHKLSAGTNRLRITLGPPNPQAIPRNMVGLDYVLLVRLPTNP